MAMCAMDAMLNVLDVRSIGVGLTAGLLHAPVSDRTYCNPSIELIFICVMGDTNRTNPLAVRLFKNTLCPLNMSMNQRGKWLAGCHDSSDVADPYSSFPQSPTIPQTSREEERGRTNQSGRSGRAETSPSGETI